MLTFSWYVDAILILIADADACLFLRRCIEADNLLLRSCSWENKKEHKEATHKSKRSHPDLSNGDSVSETIMSAQSNASSNLEGCDICSCLHLFYEKNVYFESIIKDIL
jgi:hypothetical protein